MIRIGVQLHPQHCRYQQLAQAALEADRRGLDTLWVWDHFSPLYGTPDAPLGEGLPPEAGDPIERGGHFEGWTVLAALAAITAHIRLGMMVSCNSYRNPDLLADMYRTVDHISNGRAILGLGSGWHEPDYRAYGYPFGTAASRIQELALALPRIKDRLEVLKPKPLQSPVPLLIGGGGENLTLPIVAEHATMWNYAGDIEDALRKNRRLDTYCRRLGREPSQIERTVMIRQGDSLQKLETYLDNNIRHFVVRLGTPFDFAYIESLQNWRKQRARGWL